MIDTHCHLNDTEAFSKPAEAIERARKSGVVKLIVVGIDTESSRLALSIADEFDDVYAVVGWHPTSAARYSQSELVKIQELAAHPKCVAIGEVGFDFYWDFSTKEEQVCCLIDHLDLAKDLELPVVFHCREAYKALLDVLELRDSHPYLFHCFAGTIEDAHRAKNLGAIFGVDGPVTYKKADDLREVLKFIGLENIVLETDSPWMSPVPYRGKPNEPSYLGYIRDAVASTLNVSAQMVTEKTTQTAISFFKL